MNLSLPAEPGAYALHLRLDEPREIQVGRLGKAVLSAGDYLYFGSAAGPGGIRGRLGRHLRGGKHAHWHIDYLRACARLRRYYYLAFSDVPESDKAGEARLECIWSQRLLSLPGARVPVAGFGASDCRSGCAAHLLAFPAAVSPRDAVSLSQDFEKRIQAALASAAGVAVEAVVSGSAVIESAMVG